MLNKHELRQSSIEKEACAIVEAVRKWSHFLSGRRFKIVTDQRAVKFMYSSTSYGKIKNEKIMWWRMFLCEFDFEIVYRAGKLNNVPDGLSRVHCASMHFKTNSRFALSPWNYLFLSLCSYQESTIFNR